MNDQEFVNISEEQIQKYKTLLHDKLKPQLKILLQKRDRLLAKIEDYRAILKLSQFQKVSTDDQLQFQIDFGAKTFIQTQATNKEKILINVGLGVYIEVNYSELEQIIPKIIDSLQVKENDINKEIIKVQIDLNEVQNALQQIRNANY